MATPQGILHILRRINRTMDDLQIIKSSCPWFLVGDMWNRLLQLSEDLRAKREEELLKEAREETSLQYQWCWWVYPEKRGDLPSLLEFSATWYDYLIDAVNAACKAQRPLHWKDDLIYVCVLQARSSTPDIPLLPRLSACYSPSDEYGQIPVVGRRKYLVKAGECVLDAVYAAHEAFREEDVCGSRTVQFILLERGSPCSLFSSREDF